MYLGNQPALSYTSFAKQDFTTSATTSYTLDNPVANANELALFINFVRQEPTTAYSASGTNLILTSATSATDDMYCVFLGKAVQTVNPPNASVGASQIVDSSIALGKLSATGTKDATTFLRGDNTFAVAGGTNTPNFFVRRDGNQSITPETWTKVQLNSEIYDSASAFDSSTNYRFTVPSGQGGKYFFQGSIYANAGDNNLQRIHTRLYKNGSAIVTFSENDWTNQAYRNSDMYSSSAVLSLSAGDYIELYVTLYTGSGNGTVIDTGAAAAANRLIGYKIIE